MALPGSSGYDLIDGLIGYEHSGTIYNYSWLNYGNDNVVTFEYGNVDGYGWSAGQRAAWRLAAEQFENVANITFVEASGGDVVEISENWVDSATMTSLTGDDWSGYHYFPDLDLPNQGFYNIERSWLSDANLVQGGAGFRLLMHEIGHSLGLFHPHSSITFPGVSSSSDLGDNDLNQFVYTIMSYNRGILQGLATNTYGHVGTLSALDIAAMQYLYGANMSYQTGDDTYLISDASGVGTYGRSIWDADGNDTIQYIGNRDATINLKEATLLNEVGGGGFLSYADGVIGGYSIAKGANIENATSGNGDDILTGNALANVLTANSGNDMLDGGEGDDALNGGAGNDVMDGGAGVDTALYVNASGGVQVYLNATKSRGADGYDRLYDVENVIGSAFADRLVGDANDNVLSGGDGNDIIKGKDGNDTFNGDGGDDKLIGGAGNDTMFGGTGSDILIALAGLDTLNGGADDDFLYGGKDNDTLNGDGGADRLKGNRGVDTLNGGDGDDDLRGGGQNDTLTGGDGNDFLYGENHLDTLFGGAGNDVLTGGSGSGVFDGFRDTFVYADTGDGGGGFDRVKDFENGIDLIDLQSFGFGSFGDVQTLSSNSGSGLRINFGGGDVLYVENFNLASFDASDVLI